MYLGPQRKRNRWFGYDYKSPGLYFVTICVKDRLELLGSVNQSFVKLNDIGGIIRQQWLWLEENYKYIKLDRWIIMPNHLHGIIKINNKKYFGKKVGNGRDRSLHIKPLHQIIGAFKTTSSKLIHQYQNNFHFAW